MKVFELENHDTRKRKYFLYGHFFVKSNNFDQANDNLLLR